MVALTSVLPCDSIIPLKKKRVRSHVALLHKSIVSDMWGGIVGTFLLKYHTLQKCVAKHYMPFTLPCGHITMHLEVATCTDV